ncbi:MAG: methyl-accepting chemotaxis protein, partial [Pseudomonadales bacterium]
RPIATLTQAIKELSSGDGDLTVRLNLARSDEFGILAKQVDNFIAKIHQLVQGTDSALKDASAAVMDVEVLADQAKVGAGEQKDKLHHTVDLVGGNRQGVAAVHESVDMAQQQALQIDEQTQNGRKLVESTTQSIAKLSQEVSNAGESVQKLASESGNITSLLKVIEEIADQTNLLALNAAIEAARAGDAGRGFAVVAEEVRALSKKTRDSTQDIQKTIGGIQGHVQQTHDVMLQSSELAGICVSQGESVHSAFNEIAESIGEIVTISRTITEEIAQQNKGMAQIDGHVTGVSKLADDNAQAAHSLQEQAKLMNLALQQVNQKVQQFKI